METPGIKKQELSNEELKSLTDAIHQRHGIDFSCYEPKSLKRRIIRAIHIFNMNGVHDLWIRILKDRDFIYAFMDEISVGLTSMFRDPVLWKRMKKLLKEEFAGSAPLQIWHAGCSTGEEVYTMGIVLQETKYKGEVKADATDISQQAMQTAQKGAYNAVKISDYEEKYKEYNAFGTLKNYYKADGDMNYMDKGLLQHVTFNYHNLITDPYKSGYDLIFCRNVLIYFDTVAKKRIFDKFYQALKPGGLVVIGFYDAMMPLIDATKFEVMDLSAKIFKKI